MNKFSVFDHFFNFIFTLLGQFSIFVIRKMSCSSFFQWKCKTETFFNSCSVNFKRPRIETLVESNASTDTYQYLQKVRFFDERTEELDEDDCCNGNNFDSSQVDMIRKLLIQDYENSKKSNDVKVFFDWNKPVITYSWSTIKRKVLSKRDMNKQINDLKFCTVNLIRLPLGKKQVDLERYKVENLFKNPSKTIPSIVLRKNYLICLGPNNYLDYFSPENSL